MNYNVALIGAGITNFGKFINTSIKELTQEAVSKALAVAGIDYSQIEQVYFSNAAAGLITGQEMIRGQVALRDTGLLGKPIFNIENACASSSTAFYLGCQAIESGQADCVLIVGAEKLTHVDRSVSLSVFGSAVDLEESLPENIGTGSGSLFMDIYAEKTRQYMKHTGATSQDFAKIVVKSRRAASLNKHSQFQQPVTIEEVLNARMISEPLTLPMCSSIGDGAAALVLCSDKMVKRLTAAKPVWLVGSAICSGQGTDKDINSARRITQELYEMTGIGPQDIDVVELHDATAPAELIHYENLQLCSPGDALALLRSGATDINGRISVNPSGGLLSRGHPIGATGAAQIVEIFQQLRGEAEGRQKQNARVGMTENNGGQIGGDAAVAIASIFCI